jgi:hypothetical protein
LPQDDFDEGVGNQLVDARDDTDMSDSFSFDENVAAIRIWTSGIEDANI